MYEFKHKTCSIEMKFVIYVSFMRSGIFLTRIQDQYSSLDVCTCTLSLIEIIICE